MTERDSQRVGADTEEGHVAEWDVAGIAAEQVPRAAERGVHEREDGQAQDPVLADDERQRRQAAERHRRTRHPRPSQPPHRPPRCTVPNIPWGLTSRTAKKANDDHTGDSVAATTASATPMSNAATTEPPRLPSPPSTTIDNSREIRS